MHLNKKECKAMRNLTNDMLLKMDKNGHKKCPLNPTGKHREWRGVSFKWLIKRTLEELIELKEELINGNLREAQLECADVANFIMMIHDNINILINFEKEFSRK